MPAIGGTYWAVFVVASVFGANMGDVAALYLGMGKLHGMPVLVLALFAILIAERLDNFSSSRAWYWMAIALIPMVATNLGDFAVGRGYSRAWLVGGLVVLQVVTYFGGRSESEQVLATRLLTRPGAAARPMTDVSYWVAMVIASTLGPVVSDIFADRLHMGPLDSAAILLGLVAAVYGVRRLVKGSQPLVYWPAVILIRAAGNALGDVLAKDPRIHFGVGVSAALMGVLLVVLVVAAPDRKSAGGTSPQR